MYVNYHKHTDYSSITVPDTHIKVKDYFDRMVELGHTVYFTTEHGYGGDIFDPFMVREKDIKYKDIKICFGTEVYMTANKEEKIRDNYHLIILARNDNARKKINKIVTKANKDNYYYQARVTVDDFKIFDKDDVYITTACLATPLRDEIGFKNIFIPLFEKFGDSIFLEVQNHSHINQIALNKKILKLSEQYNLRIIHGNDSHYIYPSQLKDRLIYLEGFGITYDDEDTFILDYPDRETIVKRYKEQGVLSDIEIETSLDNTLLFAECEEIKIDKTIKMPNMFKGQSPESRMERLEYLVYNTFHEHEPKIPPWDREKVREGIELELDIIRETNDEVRTADYFLLHRDIVRKAKDKGGVLTNTARGSAGSFYINYLLGFIGINRFALDVPLYPTRFISKSRLLETRSLADIDLNVAEQEPFIEATRDILGEKSCFPIIAYGTIQESGSFRNYCRWIEKYIKQAEDNKQDNEKLELVWSKLVEISEMLDVSVNELSDVVYKNYNEVAKKISKDGKDVQLNGIWEKIFQASNKFVGSINSSSQHPCSVLLMDSDIESELGVIKIGDAYCVPITSHEVDHFKYLKSDFLLVSTVRMTHNTFKEIGKPVPTVEELIPLLDDKVWDLYAKGLTATLNQVDSNFATNYVMKYKPTSYQELSQFVASIRPGFKSLLEGFLNREEYSTGVPVLDEVLADTNHYMLYQESIMKYLVWLGVPEDQTYGLISKIAKKILTQEEVDALHNRLGANWIKINGSMDGFDESWQVVEDAGKYAFNCSHSVAVAFDSLYGAYLKANYPLEYYTVALNEFIDNSEKVDSLISELPKFGIKLSSPKLTNPSGTFSYSRETNTIYQGIGSMKYISSKVGESLKELSEKTYTHFIDLLYDMSEKGIDSRQIGGLIKAGFFDDHFPNQNKLLYIQGLYNTHRKFKSITKTKIKEDDYIFNDCLEIIKRKGLIIEQERGYKVDNMKEFLKLVEDLIVIEDLPIREKISNQIEALGIATVTIPDIDKKYIAVKGLNSKYSPVFDAYCLANGQTVKLKVYKNKPKRQTADSYSDKPFKDGDILYVNKFEKKRRSMYIDGQWKEIEPPEYEWWAREYTVVEDIG